MAEWTTGRREVLLWLVTAQTRAGRLVQYQVPAVNQAYGFRPFRGTVHAMSRQRHGSVYLMTRGSIGTATILFAILGF